MHNKSELSRFTWLRCALLICFGICTLSSACAAEELASTTLKVNVSTGKSQTSELLSIRVGERWVPALGSAGAVLVRSDSGLHDCLLQQVRSVQDGLLLQGDCRVGTFEQRIVFTAEMNVLDVSTTFHVAPKASIYSVEDRYNFLPPLHKQVDELTGPLDFVWSQNIKSEADDLIPTSAFKSPVVMMQQGRVFAAVMPHLNQHHVETRALDLDVTSGEQPWLAYGAISAEPHDHSYFRRASKQKLTTIASTIEYQYSIVLSSQPEKLGYRLAVHRLWQQMGHPALMESAAEQQNTLRPQLSSFQSWREDAWRKYADRIYLPVDCGQNNCGTLSSNRNYQGDWSHPSPDAWFNAWFETLRTAYGWYLHGRTTQDAAMMAKAESILSLALSAPQTQGAFPTIYLVEQHKWIPGDGWAGYADSYQTFSMSWTAYWMLRWAEDLTPQRKPEVLKFVESYADFLIAQQRASGVIPSWYTADTLQPREEFRDFNAETAPSALLLAALGKASGKAKYTQAAERAMDFVTREVLPRQRWFDYETYLSCARKDFSFYDGWTAQYPQNNLAEMQAPQALLTLYQSTGKPEYLERGTQMLDYLLLTQQVWNNPQFTPMLLGGFTTQNTDAEWSDARQGYAAALLGDYYQATGNVEYLERAVAAARSTFAVAPWENWAHTGYRDEPGALTGFHWGTGSAMTSVEMLSPLLGDGLIDGAAIHGVGFDECTISDVQIDSGHIAFRISSPDLQRSFLIRFRGLDPHNKYQVSWNDSHSEQIDGEQLMRDGLKIASLKPFIELIKAP